MLYSGLNKIFLTVFTDAQYIFHSFVLSEKLYRVHPLRSKLFTRTPFSRSVRHMRVMGTTGNVVVVLTFRGAIDHRADLRSCCYSALRKAAVSVLFSTATTPTPAADKLLSLLLLVGMTVTIFEFGEEVTLLRAVGLLLARYSLQESNLHIDCLAMHPCLF